MLDEELESLAWTAHPYRWPVIGWMGDIEAISRDDCLAWRGTYYAPSNALLFVVCSWIFVITLSGFCIKTMVSVPAKRHDDFPDEAEGTDDGN